MPPPDRRRLKPDEVLLEEALALPEGAAFRDRTTGAVMTVPEGTVVDDPNYVPVEASEALRSLADARDFNAIQFDAYAAARAAEDQTRLAVVVAEAMQLGFSEAAARQIAGLPPLQ